MFARALQPSLGGFIVKPTQFIDARIPLVHCYLAYPAQNTYIFKKGVWHVTLADLKCELP